MSSTDHRLARVSRIATGLGFLLLLTAGVLSFRVHFRATAQIVEGEQFEGRPEDYLRLAYDRRFGIPEVSFYTEALQALHSSTGQLAGISATVRIPGPQSPERLMTSRAPLTIGDVLVRPITVDIAPRFRVRPASGTGEVTLTPRLSVWRDDGIGDSFTLPGSGQTVHVRFFANFYQTPAGPKSYSNEWHNPVLELRLDAGPAALLRPGDWHRFGPIEIELQALRRWSTVEVVQEGSSLLWYAALSLLLAGVAGSLAGRARSRSTVSHERTDKAA